MLDVNARLTRAQELRNILYAANVRVPQYATKEQMKALIVQHQQAIRDAQFASKAEQTAIKQEEKVAVATLAAQGAAPIQIAEVKQAAKQDLKAEQQAVSSHERAIQDQIKRLRRVPVVAQKPALGTVLPVARPFRPGQIYRPYEGSLAIPQAPPLFSRGR